ncbi:hypothetical protein ABPG72_012916 [Tetrahymena utriculariae]
MLVNSYLDSKGNIYRLPKIFIVYQDAQIINIADGSTQGLAQDYQDKIFQNQQSINKVAYSSTSQVIVSCGNDGVVIVWQAVETTQPIFRYKYSQIGQKCIDFTIFKSDTLVIQFQQQVDIINIYNHLDSYSYSIKSSDFTKIQVSKKYIFLLTGNNLLIFQQKEQVYKMIQLISSSSTASFNQFFINSNAQLILVDNSNTVFSYQFLDQQTIQVEQNTQIPPFQLKYPIYRIIYLPNQYVVNGDLILINDSQQNLIVLNILLIPILNQQLALGSVEKCYFIDTYLFMILKLFDKNYVYQYISGFFDLQSRQFNIGGGSLMIQDIASIYKTILPDKSIQYTCILVNSIYYTSYTLKIYINVTNKTLLFDQYTYSPDQNVVASYGDAQNNIIILGFQTGQVRVTTINTDKTPYKIYLSSSQNDDIQLTKHSFKIGILFIGTSYQIKCFSIHTDKLIETISFKTLPNPPQQPSIQNLIVSNNLKIIVAYIQTEIILKNYNNNQLYSAQIGNSSNIYLTLVNGVFIDEISQQVYIYGSDIIVSDIYMNKIQKLTSLVSSQQYNQCVFTITAAYCSMNGAYLHIFEIKPFFAILSIVIIQPQLVGFSFIVDQSYQQIIVYKQLIDIYNIYGVYIQTISLIESQILIIQEAGSCIMVFTKSKGNIFQRGSFQSVGIIQPSGGSIVGVYYIKSINQIAYYTDQIKFGQVLFYNLNNFQSAGFVSNTYEQNGIGRAIQVSFDNDSFQLNYIDNFGNFQNVIFSTSKTTDNQIVIPDIINGVVSSPQGYILDFDQNTVYIYGNNSIIKLNYNILTRPLQTIIEQQQNLQFVINQNINGVSQKILYLVDYQNNLFSYYNYEVMFQTRFDDEIIDLLTYQIPNNQIFLACFYKYILVFKNTINFSPANYYLNITKYQYRKILLNSQGIVIFNTLLNEIVDFDFLNNQQIGYLKLDVSDLVLCTLQIYNLDLQKWYLFVGTQLGNVVQYDINNKQMSIKTYESNPVVSIISITVNYMNIAIVMSSGNIFEIDSQSLQLNTNQSIQQNKQLQSGDRGNQNAKVSVLYMDFQSNRYFINLQFEKSLGVYSLIDHSFVNYISFPDDEYKKIIQNSNFIILASSAQINVYDNNLNYINRLRRYSRKDRISDIQLIDTNKIIVVFTTRIETAFIDINQMLVISVDQVQLTNPRLVISEVIQSQNVIHLLGISQTNIFEKKISQGIFVSQGTSNLQNQKNCESSLQFTDNSSIFNQFDYIMSTSITNMNFILSILVGNQLRSMQFLQTSSVQVIIRPIDKNKNNLLINNQVFQLLPFNVYLDNFSFQFNQENASINFHTLTQNVTFQDINITDQNIPSQSSLVFQKMEVVLIQNLLIQNINFTVQQLIIKNQTQNLTYSFLSFDECQYVYISHLSIINISIFDFQQLIISISNSKQVFIQNVNIENSQIQGNLFLFQQIQNITITKISIKNCSATQINRRNLGYNKGNSQLLINNNYILTFLGVLSLQINGYISQNNKEIYQIFTNRQYEQPQGILTLSTDTLNLTDITLSQNNFPISFNENYQKFLIYLQNTMIFIDQMNFSSNQGNCYFYTSSFVTIKNSLFTQNQGVQGASIFLDSIFNSAQIINSNFTSNSAKYSGGAIMANEVKYIKIDAQSYIAQNTAQIGGGIRIIKSNFLQNTQNKTTESIECRFLLNQANIYGNNIGRYPSFLAVYIQIDNKLILLDQQPIQTQKYGNTIVINELQSGGIIPLYIKLFDEEKQVFSLDTELYLDNQYSQQTKDELSQYFIEIIQINSLKQNSQQPQINILADIKGESLVTAKQFVKNISCFQFQTLSISYVPSQVYNYTAIKLTMSNQYPSLIIPLSLSFRECIRGEILLNSSTIIACEVCQDGTYSLTKPNSNLSDSNNYIQCKKCPQSAKKCSKDKIILESGYWRINNYSDVIVECNSNNPIICNEADAQSRNGCQRGYIGPLCETCDISGSVWDGDRYTNSFSNFQCNKCSDQSYQTFFLSLSFFLLLFYLLFSIIVFMNSYIYHSTCCYLRLIRLLPMSKSSIKDESTFFIKALVNYLQLSSTLFKFQITFLPQIFAIAPSLAGQPVTKIIISSSCLYSLRDIQMYGEEKIRALLQAVLPFVFLAFIYTLLLIFSAFKKFNVGKYHYNFMLNFLFIFFSPDCIRFFTESLSCRKIGDYKYNSIKLTLLCDDIEYQSFKYYFIVPMLVLWLLFPILIFYQLNKHHIKKDNLHFCTTKYKFGYFYLEFKKERSYWEFIRIYYKIVIVITVTLLQELQILMYLLCVVIIFAYMYLVQKREPFYSKILLKLEEISSCILILNVVFSQFDNQYPSFVFQIALAIAHYGFIIFLVLIILKYKIQTTNSCFTSFLNTIIRKISPKIFNYASTHKAKDLKVYFLWKKIFRNLLHLREKNATSQIKQIESVQQFKRANTNRSFTTKKIPENQKITGNSLFGNTKGEDSSIIECNKPQNLKKSFFKQNILNNSELLIPNNSAIRFKLESPVRFIGQLCETYDYLGIVWKGKRYTTSFENYKCNECKEYKKLILLMVLAFTLILFYFLFSIMMFMRSYIHNSTCYYLRLLSLVPISNSSINDGSIFQIKKLVIGTPVSLLVVTFSCVDSEEFIEMYGIEKIRVISQFIKPFTFLSVILSQYQLPFHTPLNPKAVYCQVLQYSEQCGGCQSCVIKQISNKIYCNQCQINFDLNAQTGLCSFNKCLAGMFYDPDKNICVSVCPKQYSPNFSSQSCQQRKQCPQITTQQLENYLGNSLNIQSISGINLSLSQNGIVNQGILIIYGQYEYAKIIDIQHNQPIKGYNLILLDIKKMIVQQQMMYYFLNNQVGLVNIYNMNLLDTLYYLNLNEGNLSQYSQLQVVFSDKLFITSYDDSIQNTHLLLIDSNTSINLISSCSIKSDIKFVNLFNNYAVITDQSYLLYTILQINYDSVKNNYTILTLLQNVGKESNSNVSQSYLLNSAFFVFLSFNSNSKLYNLYSINLTNINPQLSLLAQSQQNIYPQQIDDKTLSIIYSQQATIFQFNDNQVSTIKNFNLPDNLLIQHLIIQQDIFIGMLNSDLNNIITYKILEDQLVEQKRIPILIGQQASVNFQQNPFIKNKIYLYNNLIQDVDLNQLSNQLLEDYSIPQVFQNTDQIIKIIFNRNFNYLITCNKVNPYIHIFALTQNSLINQIYTFYENLNNNQCLNIENFNDSMIVILQDRIAEISLQNFSFVQFTSIKLGFSQVELHFFKLSNYFLVKMDTDVVIFQKNFVNIQLFTISVAYQIMLFPNEIKYIYYSSNSNNVYQCEWNTQVCITWKSNVSSDIIQNIALLNINNSYQVYVNFQSSAIFCLSNSLEQNDQQNLIDSIPNWPLNTNKYCSQIQVYNEQQILFCYIQTNNQLLFKIYKIPSLFQTQIFVLFGNYIQVLNPQIQLLTSSNQIIASFAAVFQTTQKYYKLLDIFNQSETFEIQRVNFVNNQVQYTSYSTLTSQTQFKSQQYLYIQSKQIYYSSNGNSQLFFTNSNQIISQEILQQNMGGPLPINNNTLLLISDQMNKIITLGSQINIINLNSFFLEATLPTQAIQNTYFNNYSIDDQSNSKIFIAFSDNYMVLVNITDEQIVKLCKVQIPISNENIQPIEIYSKQLDDCFLNSQIFVCSFNIYLYIFTSDQIKSGQFNPFMVVTSMSSFSYEVDIMNKVIYLLGNSILRFLDFKGEKVAQDIQEIINYGNIKFYYISDYLIVTTSKSMNIISRLTLTLMKAIQYQNIQTITSILFIKSQLQMAVSYMESTNGEIYYYSLETFQNVGQSNYSYNNNYYVSDAFYDSLNDRYFTINMYGLLVEWDTSSKLIKQFYQMQELSQNKPQQGDFVKMKFVIVMNKIFVYNQQRIFFIEYNNLVQNQVEAISLQKNFYQCYLDTSNNQICYFIDSNNNFYSYQNAQKQYIGQFSNQVMQFICLNSCQAAFIMQKSQIQIYQNYFKSSNIQQNINFFQVIPTDQILFQLRIQDIQGIQYIYNTITQSFTTDPLMQNKQERVIVSTIANSYLYMGCQDGQVYRLNSSVISSFQIQNINTKGQMIKMIAISTKQLLIIHNTGYVTFIILPDLTEQITDIINVFSYLYSVNPIEQVNIVEWDSLYERLFINQIGKSTLFILEKEVHLILTSRSLPSQCQSRLRFSQNYIFLHSQNQINIFNRIDLSLFDIIRKQINVYNIIEIITVYSDVLDVVIVFYIYSIEIYYLNSSTKSAVLITQTQQNLNYPQLLNTYISQNVLYLSFFSQSNIYDLKVDINSYSDNYCIGIFNYNNDFQSDKNIYNYNSIAQKKGQNIINYQNFQIMYQTQLFNLLLPNQTFRFYSQNQFNIAFYPEIIANNYLNITQQTFSQKQQLQNTQFFSNFSLSDFNLQFVEDSSSVQFPQNVQNVFLNNIIISQSKKISNNNFYFNSMNSLIISFLTLDSLKFDSKVENSLFNIFNVSTVSIQNLIIKNCQFSSIYSIFSIQQVKNLNIDSVNISSSQLTRIFFISQIFNSTLTNISIMNCYKQSSQQGQLRFLSSQSFKFKNKEQLIDNEYLDQSNQNKGKEDQNIADINKSVSEQTKQINNITTFNKSLSQPKRLQSKLSQPAFQQSESLFDESQNQFNQNDDRSNQQRGKFKSDQQILGEKEIKKQGNRQLDQTISQESQITSMPRVSMSVIFIQGCINIQLQNIDFQNNQNISLLSYEKQVDNNEIVQYYKQSQTIVLYNFTITNNSFTQQDTNRYNYIIYISTDTVKLDTINYYLNQANIQIVNIIDFYIVNSVFIRNSCLSGCALYLYNIQNLISIQTSIFQNNIARANGGAILVNYFNQIEIDKNSVISENKALIGGGVRLLNSQSGSQLNYSNLFIRTIFSNQATLYGNNIATYLSDIIAFKIETDKIHEQSKISIQNSVNLQSSIYQNNQQIVKGKYIQILSLQSGGKFSFGIQLVDNEGVKWNFDQSSFLNNGYPSEIAAEIKNYSFELIQEDITTVINGRTLTNINSYNSTERAITFSSIIISQYPNANSQLYLKYNINQQIGQQLILVDVKFRQCIQGEIYQYLPLNVTICYICPPGTYSLQKFNDQFLASPQQTCLPCPQGALSCNSNQIQILNGFWKSQSDLSDDIIECKNKPFACKSQDPNSQYGCTEGYIGPLCESCDIDGLVWSQNKTVEDSNSQNLQTMFVQRRYRSVPQMNQCRECGSLQSNLIYFFLLLSLLILITYLLLLTIIKTFTHYCKATYIRLMEILPVSSSCLRDNVPFHIKIILNFLQISVLTVNLNENIGNRIKTSISIVGETTSQLAYSFSCIYPSQWNNDAGYTGLLGIQNTILPFFYIAAVCMLIQFISFIVYMPQAKNKSQYFSSYTNPHATIISIQFLIYYLQPNAVHFLLSSMRCRTISGNDYVNFYPATLCNDEKFQKIFKLFFIPSLIFWLGAPLIFSLFLIKRRKSLLTTRTVLKYGFLYLEFKNQFYLWEFVRIYKKTLIVIINGYLIYSDQQSLSKIIITIILVIYVAMKLIYQPFQNNYLSYFDTISNFVLALIVFLQYIYEDYARKSQIVSDIIAILYCSYIIIMILIASLSKFFYSIHMFSHFLHQKIILKILPKKIYSYMFKHRQIIKLTICKKWILIQRNINFIIATQAMNNFQNIHTLDKVNIFNLKAQQFLEDNIKALYENEQNQKTQKEVRNPKKGDALGLSISIQESDYQVNKQAQDRLEQFQDNTFAVEKIIEKNRVEFDIDQQKQKLEQQSYNNDQYQLNQMPVTQNVSINNSFLNNYTPISNKNKQQLSNSSIQIFQDSVKNIQTNKKNDKDIHTPSQPLQTPEQENLNFSSHPNIISLNEIKVAIDQDQRNPKGEQKLNKRVFNVQEIDRVSSFHNSNQKINFTLQTEKDTHDRLDDKLKINEDTSLIQFD